MKKFTMGKNTGLIYVLSIMVFMLAGIYIVMLGDPLMVQNKYVLMFLFMLIALGFGLLNDGKFVKK